MSYILSAERSGDVVAAFRRYQEYLATFQPSFPPGGYALASSDWYFYPPDHRCPHDAWLESLTISEAACAESKRATSIHIRLLGAYHDGFIEFRYGHVSDYALSAPSHENHGDWLYDEFRVSPEGRLIHEIEWAGSPKSPGSCWRIEASDVEFQWLPK